MDLAAPAWYALVFHPSLIPLCVFASLHLLREIVPVIVTFVLRERLSRDSAGGDCQGRGRRAGDHGCRNRPGFGHGRGPHDRRGREPRRRWKGPRSIRNSLHKRVDQGKLSRQQCEQAIGCLQAADQIDGLRDADLVIEAVFEDAAAKRGVLAQIESVCRDGTILASNTSTINLDELAEGMRHPRRLMGMHFFHPAQHMPLVEIIRREATPPEHLAAAMHFAKRIRKRPCWCETAKGSGQPAVRALPEGGVLAAGRGGRPEAIDGAMVEFGFPMGPLALIDMAGLDIVLNADRMMSQGFPHHGSVSPIVLRLVEQAFGPEDRRRAYTVMSRATPRPTPAVLPKRSIAGVQRELGRGPRRSGRDEITERLVLRMVAEALRVVEEGVAGVRVGRRRGHGAGHRLSRLPRRRAEIRRDLGLGRRSLPACRTGGAVRPAIRAVRFSSRRECR